MAFPQTSVLDDFNGTDTDPINGTGIWASGDVWPWTSQTVQRVSNKGAKTGGADHGSICTSASYDTANGDVEVGYTGIGLGDSGTFYVFLHINDPNVSSQIDMYFLQANEASDAWHLNRYDNESTTEVDSGTQAISAGDGLGLLGTSTGVTPYYYNGTSWSTLASESADTNYTSGQIGFALHRGSGDNIDDFFGGEVAANTRRYSLMLLGVG